MSYNAWSKMDHVSLAYGILHGFDDIPDSPQWTLIARAVRARNERNPATVVEILEQIGTPQSDSEAFAVEFLRTSAYSHLGDIGLAKSHARRLEDHPLYSIPILRAAATMIIGPLLHIDRNNEEALSRLLRASAIFRELNWNVMEALCIAEIGNVQFAKGDTFGALASYLSALPTIEASKLAALNGVLVNIASLAIRNGDYDTGLQWLDQLYMRLESSSSGPDRANVLIMKAVCYMHTQEYRMARDCYSEAHSIINRDRNPTYYLRVKNGLADLSLREGDVPGAYQHITDVGDLDLSLVFPSAVCVFLGTKAEVFSKLGRHQEAREIFRQTLEQARDLARSVKSDDVGLSILAAALESVTDPDTRLLLLEEYWEVSKQGAGIAKDGVRAILDVRSQYEQERSRIAIERQKELANAIVETQQLTMNDIGRDLHDSLGQDVTVMSMLVDRLRANPTLTYQEVLDILDAIHSVTQRIATDSRRISHRLLSKVITSSNLSEALEEMKSELSTAAPFKRLDLNIVGSVDTMPDEVALTFYRIAQSTLNNVVRHAEATTCTINLVVDDDHFYLGIEDDGKGFDPRKVREGIGLRESKARAELIGGTARVQSQPGKGTHVEVTVPKKKR